MANPVNRILLAWTTKAAIHGFSSHMKRFTQRATSLKELGIMLKITFGGGGRGGAGRPTLENLARVGD